MSLITTELLDKLLGFLERLLEKALFLFGAYQAGKSKIEKDVNKKTLGTLEESARVNKEIEDGLANASDQSKEELFQELLNKPKPD